MARVFIPTPMRKLADNQTSVDIPGGTVREVIENLEERYPGMREHLMEDDQIKPGLAAVVDGRASRQGLRHKLQEDTEVHFLPQISGGRHEL